MERLEFLCQGSQADPYRITVEADGSHVYVGCDCAAGRAGQVCKHRLALLSGDTLQPSGSDPGSSARLAALIEGTDLQAAFKRLKDAEADAAKAKAAADSAKKALARIMQR